MPPLAVGAIVAIFVCMDVIIVWAIMRTIGQTMKRLAVGHAPVEPEPGAVRREFQSFKLGIINLGYSIHVTVDAAYLHLDPSLTARWIGIKPMSIPWEHIEWKRDTRHSGTRVRINGLDVFGPTWAMKLATGRSDR